jgi:hypothetical protein
MNFVEIPEELILEVIHELVNKYCYMDIHNLQIVCKRFNTIIDRNVHSIFKNLSYAAWQHTRIRFKVHFNALVKMHYEMDVDDIKQLKLNSIPNMYNHTYYKANDAINKFIELRNIIYEICNLKEKRDHCEQTINITEYIQEIDYLINILTKFMIIYMDIAFIDPTYSEISDQIRTEFERLNNMSLEFIKFSVEVNKQNNIVLNMKIFLSQLSSLNTLVCFITKLINDV